MPIYTKVNNQMKKISAIKTKYNGQMVDIKRIMTKVNGQMAQIFSSVSEIIREFMGYPIQTAYSLAGDSINWKLYGNTIQEYAPVTSDDETNYPSELIGWATTTFNGSEDWKTGASLSSTIYTLTTDLGVLRGSSANRRIYNENYITADTLPSASDRDGYVLRGNSASSSWIGFGETDNYTPTTWKAYLTTHPQTVLFPLHVSDNSVWKAVKRMSDNKFGYLCVSGNEENTFIVAKGLSGTVATPTPSTPIDILSVGDKTKNLFNINETRISTKNALLATGMNSPHYCTVNCVTGGSTTLGDEITFGAGQCTIAIPCKQGDSFTINYFGTVTSLQRSYAETDENCIVTKTTGGWNPNSTITVSSADTKILFIQWSLDGASDNAQVVVVKGSERITSYVPYGYQIPIKVNGTVQNTIYLPTQLFKTNTYVDYIDYENQRIVRNVGIKVFDGTENWAKVTSTGYVDTFRIDTTEVTVRSLYMACTHFTEKATSDFPNVPIGSFGQASSFASRLLFKFDNTSGNTRTLADWKAYLASEYANGTPVTIVYPIATSTTESLTVPNITLSGGTNIITTDTQVKPSDGYIMCNCSR